MRFVLFLLAVLITCLSTPTWAEQVGKKPIPVPQDMSKAIKESPFPAPINHCDPNKPQDMEQDCAEDPLHMYQRLLLESFLNLHEEQIKKGLSLPEDCGCSERHQPETDPVINWRGEQCIKECKKLLQKCDLSAQGYNRKTCIQKFLEVEKIHNKTPNKTPKNAVQIMQPEEITEDPLHKWRRLQEERLKRENPDDPCSNSFLGTITDMYCFFKREAHEMKITEQIENLKKEPDKYLQKRKECGCKETVPDESDPLWKWRESSCMKSCLRKDSK